MAGRDYFVATTSRIGYHAASYLMGAGNSFPWDKVARI
jgi:hypothetical protein